MLQDLGTSEGKVDRAGATQYKVPPFTRRLAFIHPYEARNVFSFIHPPCAGTVPGAGSAH